MNYYRNKKTGAVVKSICKITGANWEQVRPKEPGKPVAPTEAKKEPAATKTTTEGKKSTAGKKEAKA